MGAQDFRSLANLDLSKNQLLDAGLHQFITTPPASFVGQLGYNTTPAHADLDHFILGVNTGKWARIPRANYSEIIGRVNAGDTSGDGDGLWTFNRVGAPFAVGANSTGIIVPGLNADLLDGFNPDPVNTLNTIALRYTDGRLRVGNPVESQDAVTKSYADNLTSGNKPMGGGPVRAITIQALPGSYSSATNAITATNNGAASTLAAIFDNVSLVVNDRVLFRDQTPTFSNGVYSLTTNGTAGTPCVFTRTSDADDPGEVSVGATVNVREGTYARGHKYRQSQPVANVDTDPQIWVLDSTTDLQQGPGIIITGNKISFQSEAGYAVSDMFVAASATNISRLAFVANKVLRTDTAAPYWGDFPPGITPPTLRHYSSSAGLTISPSTAVAQTGSALEWQYTLDASAIMQVANPTKMVGVGAAYSFPGDGGTSTSALRSDVQLRVDTAIIPTWSGLHTFGGLSGGISTIAAVTTSPAAFATFTAAPLAAAQPLVYTTTAVVRTSLQVPNPATPTKKVSLAPMAIGTATAGTAYLAYDCQLELDTAIEPYWSKPHTWHPGASPPVSVALSTQANATIGGNNYWQVTYMGSMGWGSAADVPDTFLYRSAAGNLAITSSTPSTVDSTLTVSRLDIAAEVLLPADTWSFIPVWKSPIADFTAPRRISAMSKEDFLKTVGGLGGTGKERMLARWKDMNNGATNDPTSTLEDTQWDASYTTPTRLRYSSGAPIQIELGSDRPTVLGNRYQNNLGFLAVNARVLSASDSMQMVTRSVNHFASCITLGLNVGNDDVFTVRMSPDTSTDGVSFDAFWTTLWTVGRTGDVSFKAQTISGATTADYLHITADDASANAQVVKQISIDTLKTLISSTTGGAIATNKVGVGTITEGSNNTYIRTNAQLMLSEAIVPTWTGKHTFQIGTAAASMAVKSQTLATPAAGAYVHMTAADAATTAQDVVQVSLASLRTWIGVTGPGIALNKVGLGTITEGGAFTYIRTDAQLTINEAIAPTWTGKHIFQIGTAAPSIAVKSQTLTPISTSFVHMTNADASTTAQDVAQVGLAAFRTWIGLGGAGGAGTAYRLTKWNAAGGGPVDSLASDYDATATRTAGVQIDQRTYIDGSIEQFCDQGYSTANADKRGRPQIKAGYFSNQLANFESGSPAIVNPDVPTLTLSGGLTVSGTAGEWRTVYMPSGASVINVLKSPGAIFAGSGTAVFEFTCLRFSYSGNTTWMPYVLMRRYANTLPITTLKVEFRMGDNATWVTINDETPPKWNAANPCAWTGVDTTATGTNFLTGVKFTFTMSAASDCRINEIGVTNAHLIPGTGTVGLLHLKNRWLQPNLFASHAPAQGATGATTACGSAALPMISLWQANTGLWANAAGQIDYTANGTRMAVMTSNGLGIGTYSPAALLDLGVGLPARPPIKFASSGNALMTPTLYAGAFESDNNRLWFTSMDLARHGLAFLDDMSFTNDVAADRMGAVVFVDADYCVASLSRDGVSENIGTGPVSVAVKFMVPTILRGPSYDFIFGLGESSTSANGALSARLEGSVIRVFLTDTAGNFNSKQVTGFLPIYGGRQIDLVVVRSGVDCLIYINGILQTTVDVSSPTPPGWGKALLTNFFVLGRASVGYGSVPRISRATMFNRALSQADVADLLRHGTHFLDQWGSTIPINTSNFTTSVDQWAVAEPANITLAFNSTGDGSGGWLKLTRLNTDGRMDIWRSWPEIPTNNRIATEFDFIAHTAQPSHIGASNSTFYITPKVPVTVGVVTHFVSGDMPRNTHGATASQLRVDPGNTAAAVGFVPMTVGSNFSFKNVVTWRLGAVVDLDFTVGYGVIIPDKSGRYHGTMMGSLWSHYTEDPDLQCDLAAPLGGGMRMGLVTSDRVQSTMTGGAIGTGDFTLSAKFRVRAAAAGTNLGLAGVTSSTTGGWSFDLLLYLNVQNLYVSWRNAGGANVLGSPVDMTKYIGRIVEVVIRRKAGVEQTYINGLKLTYTPSSASNGSLANGASTLYLHSGSYGPTSPGYQDAMYSTRFFNRALTDAEILSLTRHGIDHTDQWGSLAGPILGCVVDLDYSGASPVSVPDNSSNNFDGTVIGTPEFIAGHLHDLSSVHSSKTQGIPWVGADGRLTADATKMKWDGTAVSVFGNGYLQGAIGVGVSPTGLSWIEAAAGTTARAPLRLGIGSFTTTPTLGSIEADAVRPYYTNSVPARRGLAFVDEFGFTNDPAAKPSGGIYFDQTARIVSALDQVNLIGQGDMTIWARFRVPTAPRGYTVDGICSVCAGPATGDTNTTAAKLQLGALNPYHGQLQFLCITAAGHWIAITPTGALLPTLYGGKVIDVVVARSGAATPVMWINGQRQSVYVIISGTSPGWDMSVVSRYLQVGSAATGQGSVPEIYGVAVFNYAMSDQQAIDQCRYGKTSTLDQWGEMTNKTIPNAGFETVSGGIPTSWIIGTNVTAVDEAVDFHGGAHSVRFTGNGLIEATAQNWLWAIVLTAYKRHLLRAWTKKISGTGDLAIGCAYHSSATGGRAGSITTAATWTQFGGLCIADDGYIGSNSPSLSIGTTVAGSVWLVDDVTAQQVGAIVDLDLAVGCGTVIPDRSGRYHGTLSGTYARHLVPTCPMYLPSGSGYISYGVRRFVQRLVALSAAQTITHGLGTKDVTVICWQDNLAAPAKIEVGVTVESLDTVKIWPDIIPANATATVVVLG